MGLPLFGKTEGKGASAFNIAPLASLVRNASDVIKQAGTKTNPFLPSTPLHEAPPAMIKRALESTLYFVSYSCFSPNRMTTNTSMLDRYLSTNELIWVTYLGKAPLKRFASGQTPPAAHRNVRTEQTLWTPLNLDDRYLYVPDDVRIHLFSDNVTYIYIHVYPQDEAMLTND